jgi:hypothetical protein
VWGISIILNLTPSDFVIHQEVKKMTEEKKGFDLVQLICVAIGVIIGFVFVQFVLGIGGAIGGGLGGGLGAILGLGLASIVGRGKKK